MRTAAIPMNLSFTFTYAQRPRKEEGSFDPRMERLA
jgi:hypothetical protein